VATLRAYADCGLFFGGLSAKLVFFLAASAPNWSFFWRPQRQIDLFFGGLSAKLIFF
jgi:hypothetical protein